MSWEGVRKLDNRWIWLASLLVVCIAVLVPFSLPSPISPYTRQVAAWIESLPPHSDVFVAAEYDPGSYVQLSPQLEAFAILAFRHGLNLVVGSSGQEAGPVLANQAIQAAGAIVGGIRYGVNWVDIGYKPGGAATENELTQNFQKASQGVDYAGKSLGGFALTRSIQRLAPPVFSGIWVEETGSPGCIDWYQNAGRGVHLPVGCGAITGMFPTAQPYVTAGQLAGVLNGSAGAAELEQVAHHPGLGAAAQNTASLASLLVLVLVALTNLARWRQSAASRGSR